MSDMTFTMTDGISAVYLITIILFIYGLHLMNSPATARNGNRLASVGMLIAIVATLIDAGIVNYTLIATGIIIGSIIGASFARAIQMTAMPQAVAIFNGLGGGASGLIAISEFMRLNEAPDTFTMTLSITIVLSILIGIVTLSGSLVAFGKLQGIVSGRPIQFPLHRWISLLFVILIAAVGSSLVITPNETVFFVLIAACLALGILLVIPIGGADMPVVISLLNSYSGLAAAAAGFVLENTVLIVAGSLVGAAGLILTRIMTKAMNRSLRNVMFGGVGGKSESKEISEGDAREPAREVTAEDAAVGLAYADTVIFVPGYGLAVAQAQHQIKQLANLLESRGVQVKYAIHPVAGRMPGHMNVLLAEADVAYDKLFDLEQINSDFSQTDVAVVVGANDVVNPAARETVGSPIFGMPILNVDHSKSVLFLKRSMNPGFAGVDNELFYKDNTMMLFGDAKDSLNKLVQAVSEED